MPNIERALPEQAGIPSGSIMRMISRLEEKQIPMHSLLILREDKLVCECYYAPYCADWPHRMFSITKSLTAVAIGLLADEGKLSLDDKIIDYFPEKLPSNVHPYIAAMTIRDMLMMRTCHEKTTYKLDLDSDWVESFFTVPPTHPPGTIFHYDTSAAHVLCALAEKLSGMDMLDYLKEKLSPLAFSKDSYLLKDPSGVSIGGSGLVATSMDLLQFGIFLLHEGNVDGKQLLRASYVREACSFLTATAVTAPLPSEACGYGMQIWRTEKNGYVCYGMGGQLVIVLPDYDLICVTTADTQGIGGGNQQIYDALYEEVLPYLKTGNGCDKDGKTTNEKSTANGDATVNKSREAKNWDADGKSTASEETTADGDATANGDITTGDSASRYLDFISSRKLHVPAGSVDNPLASEINGKRFQILGNPDFSFVEVRFCLGNEDSSCKDSENCTRKRLGESSEGGSESRTSTCLGEVGDTGSSNGKMDGILSFGYRGEECQIPFGMGYAKAGILPLYSFRCASSGTWLPDGTLYVKVNVIDSCVGNIHFQFSFQGNQMTLFMRKQAENTLEEFAGHLVGHLVGISE